MDSSFLHYPYTTGIRLYDDTTQHIIIAIRRYTTHTTLYDDTTLHTHNTIRTSSTVLTWVWVAEGVGVFFLVLALRSLLVRELAVVDLGVAAAEEEGADDDGLPEALTG